MDRATATLDGEAVTIVNVYQNGNSVYIVYIDSSNIMKVKTKTATVTSPTTLATNISFV